jgi:hypothetical protein
VTTLSWWSHLSEWVTLATGRPSLCAEVIQKSPVDVDVTYEGISKSFQTESITKSTTTNSRWEATQRVTAEKFTRLTHKITVLLRLVAETCTICSSRCRRPVRKLLDTSSYNSLYLCSGLVHWDPSAPSGRTVCCARRHVVLTLPNRCAMLGTDISLHRYWHNDSIHLCGGDANYDSSTRIRNRCSSVGIVTSLGAGGAESNFR